MHCLLSGNALMTNTHSDDVPGELLPGDVKRSRNPAGCARPPLGSFLEDGKSPVEDLARILKDGGGYGGGCSRWNENITWCPEPRTDPLLERDDQEWYSELLQYLRNELSDTDESLPTVAAVWDIALSANAKSAQVMNLACGFQRLGMTKRFVLFGSKGSILSLRKMLPNITSVYHPLMENLYDKIINRTGLLFKSRVMKLAVAQMLLDVRRDVIITDTDISWLRDSSSVLRDSGLDFAAMPDWCQHDINTGFIYYRNVSQTRDLLHMSLSTWRDPNICADNDQYLLNCGWKRAAIKGLNYRVLPSNSWATRCTGSISCRCTALQHELGAAYGQQMYGIGDGYPYAYHTFGMTANYKNELDMLAALDMVDVDFKTFQCKKGPKNVTADILTRQCSTREDGIIHAMCDDSCKKEPDRAEEIVADLISRPLIGSGRVLRAP